MRQRQRGRGAVLLLAVGGLGRLRPARVHHTAVPAHLQPVRVLGHVPRLGVHRAALRVKRRLGRAVPRRVAAGRHERLRVLGVLDRQAEGGVAADGSFAIEGVGPGWWRVWARAPEHQWTAGEPFELTEGAARTDLVVELTRFEEADRIRGIVLDPDGQPVPRVSISIRYRTPTTGMSTSRLSGDDGRFEIVVDEPVPHDLGFQAFDRDLAPVFLDGVRPGTRDLEVRLPAPVPLTLDVRSAEGGAVVAFRYSLSDAADHTRLSHGQVTDGATELLEVPTPPRAFRATITALGFQTANLGPIDPASLGGVLEVVMEPAALVRGRVVAEGAPIAGAEVRMVELLPETRLLLNNGFRSRFRPHEGVRDTTDADGAFSLTLERSGEYVFLVEADGFATTEVGPFTFSADEGQTGIELVPALAGRIAGRVLLPGGADGEGTILGLNRGDGQARTFRAGPGGEFEVDGLAPGDWELQPREEEILPYRSVVASSDLDEPLPFHSNLVVRSGETTQFDVDLRHRGPCTISGHLRGDDFSGWSASLGIATAWFGQGFDEVDTAVAGDGRFDDTNTTRSRQ